MNAFAGYIILIYAGLLVAGGIIGWRVTGSRISLTSSLVSAALLSIAYWISQDAPKSGYLMATIVALALAVLFLIRLRKTGKFMPAGMMLILSSIVTIILAWSAIRAG